MRLSRLEIYGFKSFAKKFDLKLLGGITAIVGPNGCGKTNVVDAIRWVLGEQRPTQIRLEHMEDVIFKGSETRRPLGMSEASLTIENDSGLLPVSMPEVTVTRRLFRSGESEYLINRKTCRLADIENLFMDTGVGMDSYSVFEQGMINAILSDKTEDRRNIFEEAAGVTKYKVRRKVAINTLISIDDDLQRLSDIITELERRVDQLKRQASKASRYRELKSELKARMLSLASFEIGKLKKRIVDSEAALHEVQSSGEALKAQSNTLAAEIDAVAADMANLERRLAETAGLYGTSVRAMSEKESDIARCESRLEYLIETVTRARENAQNNANALEKCAESHGTCSEQLSTVEQQLRGYETTYAEQTGRYRTLNAAVMDKAATCKHMEQEYRRLEREITSVAGSMKTLKTRREDGEKRLRELTARIEEQSTALIRINEETARLQNQKLVLSRGKNDVELKCASLRTMLENRLKERISVENDLAKAREEYVALKTESEFLETLISSFEEYSEGVRSASKSPALEGKVHGVLGDLVSAEEPYRAAVEAAMAHHIQTLLVDSLDDAVSGVKYLSEYGLGRAGFIPADSGPVTSNECLCGDEQGVIGPAYAFVRTHEQFMPILRAILDRTVIVDSLETACELHKCYNDVRFITLSGDCVGACGEIIGGRSSDESVRLTIGRHEHNERLKKALLGTGLKVSKLETKRTALSETCGRLEGMISYLERERESLSIRLAENSSHEARSLAKYDATAEALKSLQAETASIKESFREFDAKTYEFEKQGAELELAFAAVEKKINGAAFELENLNGELNSLKSSMNSLEIERAAGREKRTALLRELDALGEHRESIAFSVRQTQKEIEQVEAEILAVGERKKNLLSDLEQAAGDHGNLEKRKSEIELHLTGLKNIRKAKESALEAFRSQFLEISRRESAVSLEHEEAMMLLKNIVERLADEYFISPDEIPLSDDEGGFDTENEKLLLADLRGKIVSLGDVNFAAEADYNAEKERLDFLAGERADLLGAKETLMETISRINRVATARFIETFEKIRDNFRTTFRTFFDGGVCDILLAEDAEPLEAHIQITARPPGKNVRSINLLSSGERALTAISLLFAIYMVKPSPFCVLDEVDAPLDDANIDRFLRVIKEFSKKTQFIVVTHNKKTMAEADNLYGITMEEPGLSSLVSVRLSEIDTYNSYSVSRHSDLSPAPVFSSDDIS